MELFLLIAFSLLLVAYLRLRLEVKNLKQVKATIRTDGQPVEIESDSITVIPRHPPIAFSVKDSASITSPIPVHQSVSTQRTLVFGLVTIFTIFTWFSPSPTLVIIQSLLAGGAFLLATRLGWPQLVVVALAGLQLVPLIGSFGLELIHGDTLATKEFNALLVVGLMVTTCVGWLLHQGSIRIYPVSPILALGFGMAAFFLWLVITAHFIHIIFPFETAIVLQYVLHAVQVLTVLFYALRHYLPVLVVEVTVASYTLPLLLSLYSVHSPAWAHDETHLHGFGVAWIIAIMILLQLLLLQTYRLTKYASYRRLIGYLFFLALIYSGWSLFIIVSKALADFVLATMLTSVTMVICLYALISLCALVRAPLIWIIGLLILYVAPVGLLVNSVLSRIANSPMTNYDLVGLMTLVVLIYLSAQSLNWRVVKCEGGTPGFVGVVMILEVISFLIGIFLLWELGQKFLSAASAVPMLLGTFTVIGVICLVRGVLVASRRSLYAGVTLLIVVFIRLFGYELDRMEVWGQVMTFVGIGLLGVIIYLLQRVEKKRQLVSTLRPRSVVVEE